MKLILCCCLTLAALAIINDASSGKIYKWTDESGKTHYSDKPPTLNAAEVIGENDKEPVMQSTERGNQSRKATERDLAGHFIGSRLGEKIHIVFSKNGNFVESIDIIKQGRTVRNMRTYAGTWRFKNNVVEFSPSFTDHGANLISPPGRLKILSINGGELKVIWHDEVIKLKKQYNRSRVAFPESLR